MMLYNPDWTKTDIGSKTHILAWVASKPQRRSFYWPDPNVCACAQYTQEFYQAASQSRQWAHHSLALDHVNQIASRLSYNRTRRVTWGRLHKALREAWQPA